MDVIDVGDPTAPEFVNYIPAGEEDISPKGLKFIAADDSPTG